MVTQHFRLRVRKPDDTGDLFVISNVSGDTLPYLSSDPTGDGQSFDAASGQVVTGSYNIRAIDKQVGGVWQISQYLTDADGFQKLPSVKAFIERGTNGGGAWSVWVAGFLNTYRLVTGQTWEFNVGDTRKTEANRKVFASTLRPDGTSSNFELATCMIGGPVRGGFATTRDYGGWGFKVVRVITGYVQLAFAYGVVPSDSNPGQYENRVAFAQFAGLTNAARDRANGLASAAAEAAYNDAGDQYFPNITALVLNPDGTTKGRYAPLVLNGFIINRSPIVEPGFDTITLAWAASQPSVGQYFNIYAWDNRISQDNPLHIDRMHPVDVITGVWNDVGIEYDAAAAATAKSAVGPTAIVSLRITEPMLVADITDRLCGIFGMAFRTGTDGKRVLFSTHIRSDSSPGTTLTLNDLRSKEPPIFAVDETSIINTVTFEELLFSQWNPSMPSSRPPDDVVATSRSKSYDTGDTNQYGVRELVYNLPGRAINRGFGLSITDTLKLGVRNAVFDRFKRGGIFTELECKHTVSLNLGDEFILSVPHMPNLNTRGGNRILQVVKVTPTANGPNLLCLDSGTTAQPATNPTFTLVAGADARRQAVLTITNAVTLNAAGYSVRIEYDTSGSPPAGNGALFTIYSPGMIPTGAINLPRVDAGSTVNVRMRSESPHLRAGAFTAWTTLSLTALNAPASVSYTAAGGDAGKIAVAFTPGETDIPLELLYRVQGTAVGEDLILALFPAGSTGGIFNLDVGNYHFTLRHRESPPYEGVSAADEQDITVGAASFSLSPPINPQSFSTAPQAQETAPNDEIIIQQPVGGENPPPTQPDSSSLVGMAVLASDLPCSIEFSIATETSVGSGTPGSYSVISTTPAQVGDWTTVTVSAPNDGLKRYFKAREVRAGAISSGFTSVVVADPSVTIALPPLSSSGGVAPGSPSTVLQTDGSGATTVMSLISNSNVDPSANIALSKIAGGTSTTFTVGSVKIGDAGFGSTVGVMAHSSVFNTTDYAFAQQNDGATFINAKTGQSIHFRNNNSNLGAWEPTASGGLSVFTIASFSGNVDIHTGGYGGNPSAGHGGISSAAALGLILVGSGSVFDFLLGNKNGSTVMSVATGVTDVVFTSVVTAGDTITYSNATDHVGLILNTTHATAGTFGRIDNSGTPAFYWGSAVALGGGGGFTKVDTDLYNVAGRVRIYASAVGIVTFANGATTFGSQPVTMGALTATSASVTSGGIVLNGTGSGPVITFNYSGSIAGYVGNTFSIIGSGSSSDMAMFSTGDISFFRNGNLTASASLDASGWYAKSLRTDNPSGGAGNWKLGKKQTATVALDTAHYVEIDEGGTIIRLGIVT